MQWMSKLSDFLSLFHTSLFQNTVNRTRPKYRLFTNLKNKQTKIAAAIPRNSASHDMRPVYFKNQPCRMHPVLWEKMKDLMDYIQAKCSSLNLCKCSLTFSHGLVFHWGHSFRLHRVVACGFVILLQLKSLSLHSTDRILIPEPQVTEHCKRKQPTIMKTRNTSQKRKTEIKKNCSSNQELLVK